MEQIAQQQTKRCWKCRGRLMAQTILHLKNKISTFRFVCIGCGRPWPAGVKLRPGRLLGPSPSLKSDLPNAVYDIYARRTKVRSTKSEGHTRVFAEGIPRIQLDRGHTRTKRLPSIHIDECEVS